MERKLLWKIVSGKFGFDELHSDRVLGEVESVVLGEIRHLPDLVQDHGGQIALD